MIIKGCKSSTLRRTILGKSTEQMKLNDKEITLETFIELGRNDEAIDTSCRELESQALKSQPEPDAAINMVNHSKRPESPSTQ